MCVYSCVVAHIKTYCAPTCHISDEIISNYFWISFYSHANDEKIACGLVWFGLVNVMCDNSGLRSVSSCFQLHNESDKNLCRMPILELYRDERVEKKTCQLVVGMKYDWLPQSWTKETEILAHAHSNFFPKSRFFFSPWNFVDMWVCVRCKAGFDAMRHDECIKEIFFPSVSEKHSLFIQCKYSIFRQMCSIYAHKMLCIYVQQSLTLHHKRRRLFLYFTVIVCCHFSFKSNFSIGKLSSEHFLLGPLFVIPSVLYYFLPVT